VPAFQWFSVLAANAIALAKPPATQKIKNEIFTGNAILGDDSWRIDLRLL
jgi:hypothetical protein